MIKAYARAAALAVTLAGSLAGTVMGTAALAEGAQTPERGSATRAGLLDALRPHAEWMLGAPVVFVVHEMRVAGDLGFAALEARRPGGAEIDITQTPGYARGLLDPEQMDGASLQALYVLSGDTWVAQFWELGATDVWYAADALCAKWRPVLPMACPR